MLHTHRVRTLGQVRSFLDGAEPVEVQPLDRSARYEFVAQTLRRFGYWQLCTGLGVRAERGAEVVAAYRSRHPRRHGRRCGHAEPEGAGRFSWERRRLARERTEGAQAQANAGEPPAPRDAPFPTHPSPRIQSDRIATACASRFRSAKSP